MSQMIKTTVYCTVLPVRRFNSKVVWNLTIHHRMVSYTAASLSTSRLEMKRSNGIISGCTRTTPINLKPAFLEDDPLFIIVSYAACFVSKERVKTEAKKSYSSKQKTGFFHGFALRDT
jgi:hypothetical protein